jgi:hypothetical protein
LANRAKRKCPKNCRQYNREVKKFIKYSDDDQENPEINDIALHIGGHNPVTSEFEGIHWHVSNDVKVTYLTLDEKRTSIPRVKVHYADGREDEYVKAGSEEEEHGEHAEWRTMDCIDCHNRPTHIYDYPEERVDFGLYSQAINGQIPGIREDSLTVIQKEYTSREEAKEKMAADLMAAQEQRDPEQAKQYADDIKKAADYLLEAYLGNVWPATDVQWGTYREHLGHQFAEEGFGCWRCHDEEHENSKGDTISQDCSLCHDEPE